MERTYISYSEEKSKAIGAKLAEQLGPGDLITLSGDLGAGKTTFTKGIAAGLGIKRPVTSPTFTIVKEYRGHLPLYHIDAYRLEDSEEDIGFGEYLDGDGVTVIEWAVFIEPFLPENRLAITLTHEADSVRHIMMEAKGDYYESILKAVDEQKETPE